MNNEQRALLLAVFRKSIKKVLGFQVSCSRSSTWDDVSATVCGHVVFLYLLATTYPPLTTATATTTTRPTTSTATEAAV